jgi:choline monooxygenase
MMSINPQAYWHDDFLEKEFINIFSKGFFVADASLLQNDGDYSSFRMCGRPLVTRRSGSALSTFDNMCLHRANLIDPLGSGNRPFRCGYHGWQYDGEGSLERAPLTSGNCTVQKQLRSHPTVENRGLVFASLETPLPADFGEAVLQELSFELGHVFHRTSLDHDANWKLLIENVLESYHLSFVHQTSFVPTGITSTSSSSSAYSGKNSSFRIDSKHDGKPHAIAGANSEYVHAFIFPNLFISITGGLVGFISHFKPNSATHTTLEWQLFETPLLMAQKESVRKFIRSNAIAFTNKVLGEDLVLLNSSQMGIRHAHGGHQIQEVEARIAHFHEIYIKMMA